MVDWDEVFEDIDWKRGIVYLVAGLVVIGAVVFVLLDWHRANALEEQLNHDLEQARNFHETWSPPGQGELRELEQEKLQWVSRIEQAPVKLPRELFPEEYESELRRLASRYNVDIKRLSVQDETTEGYALVLPVEIVFSSGDLDNAASFLSAIHRMDEPLAVKSQPLRLGGTMSVTVEFYGFDEEGWEDVNTCDVKSTIPDLGYRDIDKVFIFKSRLQDLKSNVDQEAATLADTKKKFTQACELQTEVDRLRTEYEIIQENIEE